MKNSSSIVVQCEEQVCNEGGLPQAEVFKEVSTKVASEQQLHGLMTKLVTSEQRNSQLRNSWLPTLRQLEARLMELNSAAADAMD